MSDLIERWIEEGNGVVTSPLRDKIEEKQAEIARLKKSLEMADLSCDMKEARLGLKDQEIARLRAERFEPLGDNHHNAAKCPHCNPEYEAQQAEIERLRKVVTWVRDNWDSQDINHEIFRCHAAEKSMYALGEQK